MNLPNPFEFAGTPHAPADMTVASPVPSRSDDAAVDQFNSALEAAMPAEFGRCPGLADPPVAAADDFADIPLAELAARGFDVDAFMIDLEPVPLFLRPVIELLAGY